MTLYPRAFPLAFPSTISRFQSGRVREIFEAMKTTSHSKAEFILAQWELIEKPQGNRHAEIGDGIASNLRGTLKNPMASNRVIESLTDDLIFRINKLTGKVFYQSPQPC